jgi:hypothetical protein
MLERFFEISPDPFRMSSTPEKSNIYMKNGFEEDGYGLTYIDTVSHFPENFMRQVYWCLVQKFGIDQALAIIEHELSVYKEARA